jgi:hypothetical protein
LRKVWRSEIPVSRIRELLTYEADTGIFRWRQRMGPSVRAGQIAGCVNRRYVSIGVDGVMYFAHRLAWAYVHGECPEHIDHVNGNGFDNRIENLRPCSQTTNNHNMKVRQKESAAPKGVTLWKQGPYSKWRARIVVNKREISLGYFDTPEEAHAAYLEAAERYFGAFARTG